MKKIAIGCLLYFLALGCNCKNCGDHRKFTVTDFTQKRMDTLVPLEHKSYVGYFAKIKGNVNDTIQFRREGYFDINLFGEIDTLINGDYYGTEDIIWIFDPYKATEGELEIEYGL